MRRGSHVICGVYLFDILAVSYSRMLVGYATLVSVLLRVFAGAMYCHFQVLQKNNCCSQRDKYIIFKMRLLVSSGEQSLCCIRTDMNLADSARYIVSMYARCVCGGGKLVSRAVSTVAGCG